MLIIAFETVYEIGHKKIHNICIITMKLSHYSWNGPTEKVSNNWAKIVDLLLLAIFGPSLSYRQQSLLYYLKIIKKT